MSNESERLRELLGDDLNEIDKGRIMSRVEQTYGMRIIGLTDILVAVIVDTDKNEHLSQGTVAKIMEALACE